MKKISCIICLFLLIGCSNSNNDMNASTTTSGTTAKPSNTEQTPQTTEIEYDESKLILQNDISPIYKSEEIKFTDKNKDTLKTIAENITKLKLQIEFSHNDFNIENFSYETYFIFFDDNCLPLIITDYKGNNSIGWVRIDYSGDNYSIYANSFDENIVPFQGVVDGEEIQIMFGDGDGAYFETFIKSGDCLIEKEGE